MVDNRKDHEAKKTVLRKELQATEDELHSLKSKEQWSAELAAVEKERDAATKMIADANLMIDQREMVQKEYKIIQAAIHELKATEDEMNAKVSALKDRVKNYEAELENTKKDAAQVGAMKTDNDKFEADKVWPAKSELGNILKEKEQVAHCIKEAHEALKTHTDQVTEAGKEGENELQRLHEEVGNIQKQLAEKTAEEENLKHSKEAADEAYRKEIQDLQSSVDNLQKAAKSEHVYASERSHETKKRVEQAKVAKEEATHNRKGRERYLAVLKMGVDLVKATEASIKQLREDSATSSDDEKSVKENEHSRK